LNPGLLDAEKQTFWSATRLLDASNILPENIIMTYRFLATLLSEGIDISIHTGVISESQVVSQHFTNSRDYAVSSE
jgi:ribose/xylose/arabinose/galactoside ABC-type transport system permease subunit